MRNLIVEIAFLGLLFACRSEETKRPPLNIWYSPPVEYPTCGLLYYKESLVIRRVGKCVDDELKQQEKPTPTRSPYESARLEDVP